MLNHIPYVAMPVPLVVNPVASPSSVKSLRVLHVVNGEHFAGAERVQSHLGRCLPEHGVSADFALVKPGKFADILDEHEGRWGQSFRVPMKSRFDLRPAWRIRELIGQNDYDVLHAHTPRTAMIASVASRLTGVPWVYHVHSPAARDTDDPLSNRVNAWMERQTVRGCSHLIAVSESLRLDCISRGVEDYLISVVHNGVPSIDAPRASVPRPGGRWTIGMIALMRPRKGLEVALKAIKKLYGEKHDVILRCIGPFESELYEEEIDGLIDQLEIPHRVERIGFTDDVPKTLSQLDALVLPSLYGEGLPMVMLEAMSAGLPVVATRVEGTPEAITNGVEGLLAEPRDANGLAAAIESLITGKHDWSAMSEQAQHRHQKHFSDTAMAAGVADVYRQLLS